jgi:hypothetical protein
MYGQEARIRSISALVVGQFSLIIGGAIIGAWIPGLVAEFREWRDQTISTVSLALDQLVPLGAASLWVYFGLLVVSYGVRKAVLTFSTYRWAEQAYLKQGVEGQKTISPRNERGAIAASIEQSGGARRDRDDATERRERQFVAVSVGLLAFLIGRITRR